MKNKIINIIGAATDAGASMRGAAAGPDAICQAGLIKTVEGLGYTVNDCGDIFCPAQKNFSTYPFVSILEHASEELFDEPLFDNSDADSKRPDAGCFNNLKAVNDINRELFAKVSKVLKDGGFPVVLGGDHSLAAASVTAAAKHFGKIGLIWVDAHGDFNDDLSSPSGNIHGMPLSAATGNGPDKILPFLSSSDKANKNFLADGNTSSPFVNPKNTVLLGARALDYAEKLRLKSAGVTVLTMTDIDRRGIFDCVSQAVNTASDSTAGIYLSFDLDALDPSLAPAVGTPAFGGLTFREARVLCEALFQNGNLLGLEMVELNPDCADEGGKINSAEVAVELIATLLGKTLI